MDPTATLAKMNTHFLEKETKSKSVDTGKVAVCTNQIKHYKCKKLNLLTFMYLPH